MDAGRSCRGGDARRPVGMAGTRSVLRGVPRRAGVGEPGGLRGVAAARGLGHRRAPGPVRPRPRRRLPGHDARGGGDPPRARGAGPRGGRRSGRARLLVPGDDAGAARSVRGDLRRFRPGGAARQPPGRRTADGRRVGRAARLRGTRRHRARAPAPPRGGRDAVGRARGRRSPAGHARREPPAGPRRRADPARGAGARPVAPQRTRDPPLRPGAALARRRRARPSGADRAVAHVRRRRPVARGRQGTGPTGDGGRTAGRRRARADGRPRSGRGGRARRCARYPREGSVVLGDVGAGRLPRALGAAPVLAPAGRGRRGPARARHRRELRERGRRRRRGRRRERAGVPRGAGRRRTRAGVDGS